MPMFVFITIKTVNWMTCVIVSSQICIRMAFSELILFHLYQCWRYNLHCFVVVNLFWKCHERSLKYSHFSEQLSFIIVGSYIVDCFYFGIRLIDSMFIAFSVYCCISRHDDVVLQPRGWLSLTPTWVITDVTRASVQGTPTCCCKVLP